MLPWLHDSHNGRQPAAGHQQLPRSDCIFALHQLKPSPRNCARLFQAHPPKRMDFVKHNTCNCICQLSGQGQREQRYRPGAKPNALALAPGPVRPCNPGINDQPELADQDTTERGHKSFFGWNEADSTNHHKDELTLPQRRSSTRLYVRVVNRSVVGCQGGLGPSLRSVPDMLVSDKPTACVSTPEDTR